MFKRRRSIVQAVNDVKSCEQQVHEHTRKMEAVHIEFEEGGYHTSKAVNDVKSTEARHAQLGSRGCRG